MSDFSALAPLHTQDLGAWSACVAARNISSGSSSASQPAALKPFGYLVVCADAVCAPVLLTALLPPAISSSGVYAWRVGATRVRAVSPLMPAGWTADEPRAVPSSIYGGAGVNGVNVRTTHERRVFTQLTCSSALGRCFACLVGLSPGFY